MAHLSTLADPRSSWPTTRNTPTRRTSDAPGFPAGYNSTRPVRNTTTPLSRHTTPPASRHTKPPHTATATLGLPRVPSRPSTTPAPTDEDTPSSTPLLRFPWRCPSSATRRRKSDGAVCASSDTTLEPHPPRIWSLFVVHPPFNLVNSINGISAVAASRGSRSDPVTSDKAMDDPGLGLGISNPPTHTHQPLIHRPPVAHPLRRARSPRKVDPSFCGLVGWLVGRSWDTSYSRTRVV